MLNNIHLILDRKETNKKLNYYIFKYINYYICKYIIYFNGNILKFKTFLPIGKFIVIILSQ